MNGSQERALLWAIIERALMDAQGKVFGEWDPRLVTKRAKIWLFRWEEQDTETPFTFPWCCSFLDLCPETSRKRARILLNGGGVGEKEHKMEQGNLFSFFTVQNHTSLSDSGVYYL